MGNKSSEGGRRMTEKKLTHVQEDENSKTVLQDASVQEGTGEAGTKNDISETWAEETIADLDDFIESQGIYIRQ